MAVVYLITWPEMIKLQVVNVNVNVNECLPSDCRVALW